MTRCIYNVSYFLWLDNFFLMRDFLKNLWNNGTGLYSIRLSAI
nr:MAG TPA: hypothetical protein [Caudoviricetes sp.]